ncbi:unnamed protein product [Phytomonas sp. Hart1]|nr:unnamed protein product [Phytomonas sp. Hart1]|eukprot:CCW69151.1 unnamed protein product [Phytomonas sp. isolate Hart1]
MLDPKRRIPLMMEFLEQQTPADQGKRGQVLGGDGSAPPIQKKLEPRPSVLGAEKRLPASSGNTAVEPKSGWGVTLQNAWSMLVRISTDNNYIEDKGTPLTECNPIYVNRTIIDSKM